MSEAAPAKPAAAKAAPVHERVLLGRPSNNLTMGIVGLANVGKSTFFNVLTQSSVRAENFPFCTIGLRSSLEDALPCVVRCT